MTRLTPVVVAVSLLTTLTTALAAPRKPSELSVASRQEKNDVLMFMGSRDCNGGGASPEHSPIPNRAGIRTLQWASLILKNTWPECRYALYKNRDPKSGECKDLAMVLEIEGCIPIEENVQCFEKICTIGGGGDAGSEELVTRDTVARGFESYSDTTDEDLAARANGDIKKCPNTQVPYFLQQSQANGASHPVTDDMDERLELSFLDDYEEHRGQVTQRIYHEIAIGGPWDYEVALDFAADHFADDILQHDIEQIMDTAFNFRRSAGQPGGIVLDLYSGNAQGQHDLMGFLRIGFHHDHDP